MTKGENIMYQLPVKAIRNILLKEHESFIQSLWQHVYRIDYNVYLMDIVNESTINRIQSCETYEQLDDFISDSRRMSLQEWIDSL